MLTPSRLHIHSPPTQAAQAIEEIQRQNVALAQDNLSMQGSIEEARNHVAIVRSSEYASVKGQFDELFARQEAVLAKLSPHILLGKLRERVEQVRLGLFFTISVGL